MNNKIFLGGTCAGTTWRDELIPLLEQEGIKYFNPVVKNWTPADQEKEQWEKEQSCVHLYYITSAMKGVYSIAEVMDSFYRDDPTVFCFNPEGFDSAQIKSLQAVHNLMKERAEEGDCYFTTQICEVNSILEVLPLIKEAYRFNLEVQQYFANEDPEEIML
jgi:hypothetical protein